MKNSLLLPAVTALILVTIPGASANAVRELPADQRPPVLKAYLDSFAAEVQRFFTMPKASAVAAAVNRVKVQPYRSPVSSPVVFAWRMLELKSVSRPPSGWP
jgi:hypothetical protein